MKNQIFAFVIILLVGTIQSCTYDSIVEPNRDSSEIINTSNPKHENVLEFSPQELFIESNTDIFYGPYNDEDDKVKINEKGNSTYTTDLVRENSESFIDRINSELDLNENNFLLNSKPTYTNIQPISETNSSSDWLLNLGNFEFLPHIGLLFLGVIIIYAYVQLTKL